MKLYLIDTIRVNNFKDDSFNEIKFLWENVNIKYPEINDFVRYGLYSNYENNYRGDYDLSIASMEIVTDRPISIDLSSYKIYRAKTQKEIFDLWEEIWDDEENSKIDRIYNMDFERYNLDGTVDVFIGIK